MKRLLLPLMTFVFGAAVVILLACGKSPVDSDIQSTAANADAEFKSIEAEYLSIAAIDESDTTKITRERRMARLSMELRQMKRLLDRIQKFEQRFPNEQAREKIQLAQQELDTAIQLYQNQNVQECLEHLRLARQYIHQAMQLLRPTRGMDGMGRMRGMGGGKG